MRISPYIICFALAACGVPESAGIDQDADDATGIFGGRDGGTGDDGGSDDSGDGDGSLGDASARPRDGGATDDGGETTRSICGNGRVERGELCDDGNNFPGDGCSADCLSDETCGNHVIDPGEGCDDGNFNPRDGCDAACRLEEGCGNSILEVGEQCDDGNVADGDGCSRACQREIALMLDTDGDGISDFDEGNGRVDTDGDGVPDHVDLDSDDDGISDSIEAGDGEIITEPVDTDRDGRPDFRDLDSDADTIPDATEGGHDFDGDGLGNYADTDSDGDYVPDITEGTRDSNGDGEPDYLDLDSDGDSILDSDELFADSDGDGTPNRLDLDSDGDGRLDTEEAGDSDPSTYPIDTDSDGLPDYIDLDSDDDGLADRQETGCPASSNFRAPDSDDDGYPDMAEVLLGSNPCVATSAAAFREFTDFFFILPERDPGQEAPLEFASDIARADVHINIDSSGSMDGEINNLRTGMSTFIVPRVAAEIDDVGFGFSDYRDCRGYAFRLRQRITTDVPGVQAAINTLTNTGGGSEPGYSALRFIGNRIGVGGCLDISGFNPAASRVPGVADGTIGGVGFRNDAFPVVIHVTDESAEDGECGGCAANRDQAVSALNAIDAHMIGVVSAGSPRDQLRDIARRTGGVVPACAWDGARPGGCGAGQCCTGSNGAGVASEGGTCPLVFDISSNGTGLAESIVTGIVALVNTTSLEVTTRLRRDEDEFIATGVDTRCFIRSIIPNSAIGSGACSTTPVAADIAPVDGVLDSFRNVTPGTALFFDVTAHNDVCVTATDSPQAFFAYIDVVGDGVTILDTQTVTIIVPAASEVAVTVP